jgi:hypothetical protein
MWLIVLLIILVLLFGGGGFYVGPPYHYYGGGLSLIFVIKFWSFYLGVDCPHPHKWTDARLRRKGDRVRLLFCCNA